MQHRVGQPLAADAAAEPREALLRAIAKAVGRIDRRIHAVRGDLAKMQAAQVRAAHAQLFVVKAAKAPRGAKALKAVDWSTGEPQTIEMTLDPAKSAQEQVEALFKQARRFKAGLQVAQARLAEAESVRAKLAALSTALQDPDAILDAIETQARSAAPRDFRLNALSATGAGKLSDGQGARPAYRTFVGASGRRILVGRGAAHNDELTLHVARPRDLWLHAKNIAGAHVVVRLDKGASCPPDALVEAAHLAAHFSDARGERIVEIAYTPRRYVRKPRGSAPGAVVVDREKVLILRKQDDLLHRLLQAELLEP
jgi:predicted ribosome quality control (RQC) complex YloA/Tae2 family protein